MYSLLLKDLISDLYWYVHCYMDCLHCNYSDLLAQELVLGQQTNKHRCTMGFFKIVEIFEVRRLGSNPKPLPVLIKLGMGIAVWPSCIAIIATCWHKSWIWGSIQIYIDVQWISITNWKYSKFEVLSLILNPFQSQSNWECVLLYGLAAF